MLTSHKIYMRDIHVEKWKKKIPPKLRIIRERYRFLNLALTFDQPLEPPSKQAMSNLIKKILHPWSMRFCICYFDTHDSGHHPTPLNTFSST